MEGPIDAERQQRIERLRRILPLGKISQADIVAEKTAQRRDELRKLLTSR